MEQDLSCGHKAGMQPVPQCSLLSAGPRGPCNVVGALAVSAPAASTRRGVGGKLERWPVTGLLSRRVHPFARRGHDWPWCTQYIWTRTCPPRAHSLATIHRSDRGSESGMRPTGKQPKRSTQTSRSVGAVWPAWCG